MSRLHPAVRIYPPSLRIRVALANELQRRGDVPPMFELLDAADMTGDAAASLAAARLAYLWDDHERGLRYLRPVFDSYRKLGVADEMMLNRHQLPAVQLTAMSAAAMFFLKGNAGDAIPFLRSALTGVKDVDLSA